MYDKQMQLELKGCHVGVTLPVRFSTFFRLELSYIPGVSPECIVFHVCSVLGHRFICFGLIQVSAPADTPVGVSPSGSVQEGCLLSCLYEGRSWCLMPVRNFSTLNPVMYEPSYVVLYSVYMYYLVLYIYIFWSYIMWFYKLRRASYPHAFFPCREIYVGLGSPNHV